MGRGRGGGMWGKELEEVGGGGAGAADHGPVDAAGAGGGQGVGQGEGQLTGEGLRGVGDADAGDERVTEEEEAEVERGGRGGGGGGGGVAEDGAAAGAGGGGQDLRHATDVGGLRDQHCEGRGGQRSETRSHRNEVGRHGHGKERGRKGRQGAASSDRRERRLSSPLPSTDTDAVLLAPTVAVCGDFTRRASGHCRASGQRETMGVWVVLSR